MRGRAESLLPTGRAYLCPLDNSDDLPVLSFGPNCVTRFTADELEVLFDVPRLPRINPAWGSDPEIFSRYNWLMVETLAFEPDALQRLLSRPMNSDWAEIEPHRLRVPGSVEDALFAILLAPWEDWVDSDPGFWRPFEIPWVRRVGDDPSVRRQPPASPATLSWDVSPEGQFIKLTPVQLRDFAAVDIPQWLNKSRWEELTRAQQSPLFDTSTKHFLVKAFFEDDLDEFLAHILTIEATLGLESDYPKKGQRRPRGQSGATRLMADRVAALLGEEDAGREYCDLFNLRSTFLHGRKMDRPIAGNARLTARRLGRKVVCKLVEAAVAQPNPTSRETFLKELG